MTCDSGPPNICWIENTVLVLIRHCLCFLLLCHDRQPDEREERMRKLGPRSHENLVFLGTAKPLRLPSLIPKLQGPFRSPEDVQRQQLKPLEPTLRVATDFYCVEKAQYATSCMSPNTNLLESFYVFVIIELH
jgi:hypothetical protein